MQNPLTVRQESDIIVISFDFIYRQGIYFKMNLFINNNTIISGDLPADVHWTDHGVFLPV